MLKGKGYPASLVTLPANTPVAVLACASGRSLARGGRPCAASASAKEGLQAVDYSASSSLWRAVRRQLSEVRASGVRLDCAGAARRRRRARASQAVDGAPRVRLGLARRACVYFGGTRLLGRRRHAHLRRSGGVRSRCSSRCSGPRTCPLYPALFAVARGPGRAPCWRRGRLARAVFLGGDRVAAVRLVGLAFRGCCWARRRRACCRSSRLASVTGVYGLSALVALVGGRRGRRGAEPPAGRTVRARWPWSPCCGGRRGLRRMRASDGGGSARRAAASRRPRAGRRGAGRQVRPGYPRCHSCSATRAQPAGDRPRARPGASGRRRRRRSTSTSSRALAEPVRRLAAQSHTPFLIGTDEFEPAVAGAPSASTTPRCWSGPTAGRTGPTARCSSCRSASTCRSSAAVLRGAARRRRSAISRPGTDPGSSTPTATAVSVAICYESVYPSIARAFVAARQRAAGDHHQRRLVRHSRRRPTSISIRARCGPSRRDAMSCARPTRASAAPSIPTAACSRGRRCSSRRRSTVDVRLLDRRTIYSRLGRRRASGSSLVVAAVSSDGSARGVKPAGSGLRTETHDSRRTVPRVRRPVRARRRPAEGTLTKPACSAS